MKFLKFYFYACECERCAVHETWQNKVDVSRKYDNQCELPLAKKKKPNVDFFWPSLSEDINILTKWSCQRESIQIYVKCHFVNFPDQWTTAEAMNYIYNAQRHIEPNGRQQQQQVVESENQMLAPFARQYTLFTINDISSLSQCSLSGFVVLDRLSVVWLNVSIKISVILSHIFYFISFLWFLHSSFFFRASQKCPQPQNH